MESGPINDPKLAPVQRVAALRESLAAEQQFADFTLESNNHIHTCYSFSPYTPAMACLRGRQAGLQVVGSVDHDSIGAAAEMRQAAGLLGLGVVTGFEIRAMLHSKADISAGRAQFADRKLNNPDSLGVAYLTVQGIPETGRPIAEAFLAPIRQRRLARTRKMAEAANKILADLGAPGFDFEADVIGISQYLSGGTVTERHLLFAMSQALIAGFGPGQGLVDGLARMGVKLSDGIATQLADPQNPYLPYDLLGVLKAEYLERFYIQPNHWDDGGELPSASDVIELAQSIGAIACYAYLGDVSASPTGDKKAEQFEDDFLPEFMAYLAELGFKAITYMPPRNTAEQLDRISRLASEYGLIEVSGVDINQPRQSFACPELAEPKFAHLNTSTWAMVAHEALSNHDPSLGLLHPGNPLAGLALSQRVSRYGALGPELVAGRSAAELAETLRIGGQS